MEQPQSLDLASLWKSFFSSRVAKIDRSRCPYFKNVYTPRPCPTLNRAMPQKRSPPSLDRLGRRHILEEDKYLFKPIPLMCPGMGLPAASSGIFLAQRQVQNLVVSTPFREARRFWTWGKPSGNQEETKTWPVSGS